jgi:hypothetical protein
MSYVYIISCQRDNGKLPEIYSMWSTYEKAISAYYDACVEKSYNFSFLMMYEFPLDEKFCDVKKWSDVKLGKSCKYRMRFKDFEELESLVLSTKRDSKLTELGID